MAYPIGYWAELVRSSRGSSLIEDTNGSFLWLRTSDGAGLEQEQQTNPQGLWRFSTSIGSPGYTGRQTSNGWRLRYRKTGEDWIPSDNGLLITAIPWGGGSSYRFFEIPDLTPSLPAIANRTNHIGDNVNVQLPVASSGNAPLTYSVSGLPTGLAFNPATRLVTGTPSRAGQVATVTYRVRDTDGDTFERQFTWTIPDLTPSLPAIANRTNHIGDNVNVQLPVASSGNAPLTYSVSGLPTGLAFNPATRLVTGTPSRAGQVATVTYRVRDTDGDTFERQFTWTIPDRMPTLAAIAAKTNRVGDAINIVLPAGSGGDGALTYRATGFPSGLEFNAATRRVTGSVNRSEIATVTYSVRDADGDEAERTFVWTVLENPVPTLPAIGDKIVQVNRDVNILLPESVTGDPPIVYSLAGLPAGLAFNAATRRITGSVAVISTSDLTYTARDNDGDQAQATFRLSVIAAAAPVSVRSIIEDLADRSGFEAAEVDASEVDGEVAGYVLSEIHTAQSVIEQLADVFEMNITDRADGLHFLRRSDVPSVFLERGDMLVRSFGQLPYELSRVPDTQLPVRMRAVAVAAGTDIELTATTQRRIAAPTPTMQGHGDESSRIAAIVEAEDLSVLARDLLYRRWVERTGIAFRLPAKYLALVPGSVVEVRLDNDFVLRGVIRETTIALDWQIELAAIEVAPGYYES